MFSLRETVLGTALLIGDDFLWYFSATHFLDFLGNLFAEEFGQRLPFDVSSCSERLPGGGRGREGGEGGREGRRELGRQLDSDESALKGEAEAAPSQLCLTGTGAGLRRATRFRHIPDAGDV